ncbi:cytochrome c biogenesis protein [Lewinella sp. 4G2]|uniref:cytochrome c biogenesis protein n=1 Tax=Lewinella sp. 4G2 TaxID=1803372 RepID=UPI001E5B2B6A|nr:cytochrome c biogenesis protein CcsA [Lewinella sp. 4G2]
MMRQNWWKILGVLLVVYGIVFGMLVPLKPNLVSVSPRSATPGESVTLEVIGYNTSFLGAAPDSGRDELGARAGAKAWVRAGDGLAISASEVKIKDDRRATLRFDIPSYLPDAELEAGEAKTYPLILSTPNDGSFVDAVGITIRQANTPPDTETANAGWTGGIAKGDLYTSDKMTFPYRGLLGETIRNTYFHVSLWFAMMFVFIAACTYAVKYLRRSRGQHITETSIVSYRDRADFWSVAFTSVGMLFGILGLLTGALWAKYTWGSFWSWDIKQFTTLIALLIYAGYFALRAAIQDPEQRARLSASYNIFAFAALIPLIYIIPRISGNSLHPGAAGNPALGGEDLDNTMRMIFYPIIIGWTLMGFWMAGIKYRLTVAQEKLDLRHS